MDARLGRLLQRFFEPKGYHPIACVVFPRILENHEAANVTHRFKAYSAAVTYLGIGAARSVVVVAKDVTNEEGLKEYALSVVKSYGIDFDLKEWRCLETYTLEDILDELT